MKFSEPACIALRWTAAHRAQFVASPLERTAIGQRAVRGQDSVEDRTSRSQFPPDISLLEEELEFNLSFRGAVMRKEAQAP